jgi:hypothetical protein
MTHKSAFLLAAWLATANLCTGLPALADEGAIAGRWADSEAQCSDDSDGYYEISEAGIEGWEFHCEFEGGDTSNPRHWTMRGRCEGEGEFESEADIPLVDVDLSESNGVLTLVTSSDGKPWSLAVKCK